jgi:hypothetical protein
MLFRMSLAVPQLRLPTAAERFRALESLCGIFGGQSSTEAGFIQVPVSPTHHSTDCSLIIIHHQELEQDAKLWSMCQVDSVSPHPKKLEKNKIYLKCLVSLVQTRRQFLYNFKIYFVLKW